KTGLSFASTNSRVGFGFMHDSRVDTLSHFLSDGFVVPGSTDQQLANNIAFLLSYVGSDIPNITGAPSQDVPAATGRQITFASSPPPLLNAMSNLAMCASSRVD